MQTDFSVAQSDFCYELSYVSKVLLTGPIILQDQLERELHFPELPERIVSLVPSITELVCDLGLRESLVGVTKFCVHPHGLLQEKQIIGGTKNVNIQKVAALKPGLILASKEENVQEQIEELAARFPVYVSDVKDLPAAMQMIEDVSRMCRKEKEGERLNHEIKSILQEQVPNQRPKVAYLIWKRPFMVAGGDTYISAALNACGFENVFADQNRYPVVSVEDFTWMGCDAIFLSSEPYPFKQAECAELERITGIPCRLVDGEAFSWYGSRIPGGLRYGRDLYQTLP